MDISKTRLCLSSWAGKKGFWHRFLFLACWSVHITCIGLHHDDLVKDVVFLFAIYFSYLIGKNNNNQNTMMYRGKRRDPNFLISIFLKPQSIEHCAPCPAETEGQRLLAVQSSRFFLAIMLGRTRRADSSRQKREQKCRSGKSYSIFDINLDIILYYDIIYLTRR